MLHFKTLTATSFAQIAVAFNEAFSDYYFPITFTEAQFETKFATEGGRKDLSVGAFEKDKLVGFILHFVGGKEGVTYVYNGGTGVVPSHRGQALTSRMYEFILPMLKEANVERMILEALTQNAPAIQVYQKSGFKIQRELWCFGGSLKSFLMPFPEHVEVKKMETLNWELLQSFWDYPPTLQNSIATMKNLRQENLHIGAFQDNLLVGYLIYNPTHRRIHQLAVAKTHRRIGIATYLVNQLSNLEKGRISMINLDTRMNGIKEFLEKNGLENFGNQYEMATELWAAKKQETLIK